MIIVEGTDLVGKTTLAHRLVRAICATADGKAYYSHLGVPPAAWDHAADYVDMMRQHVVQDRLYLSEVAYGKTVRGTTFLSREDVAWLDAQVIIRGGLHVIITADSAALEERFVKYGEREVFTLTQIRGANEQFQHLASTYADSRSVFTFECEHATDFPADDSEFIGTIVARSKELQAGALRRSGRKVTVTV